MLPADNHVHSEWSFDTGAKASMDRACARAVELGVPAVAFTEHLEFTSWGAGDAGGDQDLKLGWWDRIRPLDVTGYLAAVADCRQRYPSLRIRTGVEAGEAHLFRASVAAVLAAGVFDRVLGSLHAIPLDGRLAGIGEAFAVLDADTVMRRYLAELLRMVDGTDAFEVLAHIDYPSRYWPADAGPYDETVYEQPLRAVLRALAASGRVLEVNTRSPLASPRLLGWWRDEGGQAVSFGSDAHVPWLVGARFRTAVRVVEAAGFRPGRDLYDFWRR